MPADPTPPATVPEEVEEALSEVRWWAGKEGYAAAIGDGHGAASAGNLLHAAETSLRAAIVKALASRPAGEERAKVVEALLGEARVAVDLATDDHNCGDDVSLRPEYAKDLRARIDAALAARPAAGREG